MYATILPRFARAALTAAMTAVVPTPGFDLRAIPRPVTPLLSLFLTMILPAPAAGQWRAQTESEAFAAAQWAGPVMDWAAPGVRTPVTSVPFADSIAPGGARFGGALIGGLTGLAVGAGAGFLIGSETDACGDEWCPLAALTIGAAIGESVGMATGAHLVNRGRGDLFRSAMMTTLVGAAGIGLASAFDSGAPATLAMTALAQALIASAIEGSTARARHADAHR